MPELKVPGGRIHYEVHGRSGPWLVLVSGLRGAGAFWKAQLDHFSRSYRVLVHDQRGCGASAIDSLDQPCSIDQLCEDLVSVLDAEGIERAAVVGHSMGGMIVQALALDHPERVGALVLSGAFGRIDRYMAMMQSHREQVLLTLGVEEYCRLTILLSRPADLFAMMGDAELAQLERRARAAVPATKLALSRLRAPVGFDRMDQLGRISVPVLIVGAFDDVLVPPYHSHLLAAKIPTAHTELLQYGGHFSPAQSSPEYNRVLTQFLVSAEKNGRPPAVRAPN